MNKIRETRRDFLKIGAGSLAATAFHSQETNADSQQWIRVNPEPLFDLSPYLYMQFMEPLGTTDGSVSAAWDYLENTWREDVVETTRELGPTMMRWGGCLSSYYRWERGSRTKRPTQTDVEFALGRRGTESGGDARIRRFLPANRSRTSADGQFRIGWAKVVGSSGEWRANDGETRKKRRNGLAYCNHPDHAFAHSARRRATLQHQILANRERDLL